MLLVAVVERSVVDNPG
ncbi:hypothetical protein BN874_2500003 [Candidatus Contendobacter odensis Run_B_J11]|uniref:Uncharacterized protein n=1 Tax=Candidatus Contendobacter odensis Run_B_J11 TaxID=1400861 RepID=A0A7U7J4D7_9GAMM|nr:hypothetical protein BN874_2500003 [Candidatus Contendobacter odensis Run_B_J11]